MRTEEKLKIIEKLAYSDHLDEEKSNDIFRERSNSKMELEESMPEPIAIVGMSGYLPKSMSLDEFWKALDKDISLIEEIPNGRFDWKKYYDPKGQDPTKMRSKWGGFIPRINGFDSGFFNITGADALTMDPRFRLLAMSVYSSLEDAGYPPEAMKGNDTGLFVGVEDSEYLLNLIDSDSKMGDEVLLHSANMLANHLSYLYDFRGPSETINTMSSSSAVAIHRAVVALRNGEIDQAVVGSANLILRPDLLIAQSKLGQLSSTNTVNSFGSDQQGCLYAESVASILLKPLSKAVSDGDEIYATIRGTAVNYSGRGGGSLGTPDVKTHTDLVHRCYQSSGIDPRDIVYIEAQGMGSPVPDFVEINAFNKALNKLAVEKGVVLDDAQCLISTLKPMIGHAQAASALVSIFKVVRSFKTNKVHKILHFDEVSKDLNFNGKPCSLALDTQEMRPTNGDRLVGVHSFGSGGSNAHLLIEEYVDQNMQSLERNFVRPVDVSKEEYMFVLSARTEFELKSKARQLVTFISNSPHLDLKRVAYTLQVGREAFDVRLAFMAGSKQELEVTLATFINGEEIGNRYFYGKVSTEKSAFSLLDMDEDMLKTTESWMDKKKYSKLLTIWVNGVSLDWLKLYEKALPQRLHLPTYPFSLTDYEVT